MCTGSGALGQVRFGFGNSGASRPIPQPARAQSSHLDLCPQKSCCSDIDLKSGGLNQGTYVENSPAADRPSTIVNRTVPRRRPNAELRQREYLTDKEVERLIHAARKHGRHGHRDATAILVAYRHGLRATELCDLEWSQIELDAGRIHVRRAKNGADSTHPLTGKEIRALRQLRRENLASRFVFNTERGGPVTRAWFLKLLNRLSVVVNALDGSGRCPV